MKPEFLLENPETSPELFRMLDDLILHLKQIQESCHHEHAADVVADAADDDLAALFGSGFAKR